MGAKLKVSEFFSRYAKRFLAGDISANKLLRDILEKSTRHLSRNTIPQA